MQTSPNPRSRGVVAHQQQLNPRPQRYARFIITKHNSSCAQVLLAHDTSAETLQHQQKTMKDLYILRLMVSNDTRLNMTVAIIIVAVDLPRCMIDRAIESARSLNLPPCMISSCKRDSSTAMRVHMGKIFLPACFSADWIETKFVCTVFENRDLFGNMRL